MKENEAKLAAALGRIKGAKVDEVAIRAHVMRPKNLVGVSSDRGTEDAPIIQPPPPQPGLNYELNIQGFIADLQSALTNLTAGYSLRLQLDGVATLAMVDWNWAKAPQDGSESWTPDVRMHVASLSKIVTAIAMTKLLNDQGMSYDTPIIDFLPGYWTKGPSVNLITFRQLMDHTSGLAFDNTTSGTDFEFMKEQIAAGTTHLGQYSYQNMNYGLCRILIATINGNIPVDWTYPFPISVLNDQAWDSITLQAYQAYVSANVFEPSGVTGATLYHEPADALAYNFPVSGNGWNSGDLTSLAGGTGWHMTLDQVLAVMSTFRRSGTIMSPADAQTMLDDGFGLNWTVTTQLGTYYAKIGGWSGDGGRMEQSIAFFLPQQMEFVLFVNSPVAFAAPGQLLSYGDAGTPGNVSDPVIVGFGGWEVFKFLFAGSNSVGQDRIYATNKQGQLMSYGDSGTPGNVSDPVIVGFGGWEVFKFIFAGSNLAGQARIYAVNQQGQLLSYGDSGTPGNVSDPMIVGFGGWEVFKFIFAGSNLAGQNRIYAVNQNGQLLSYGDSGTPGNVSDPVIVGFGGWTDFRFLFAGKDLAGQNCIYAVNQLGQLLSYGDTGTPGNVSDPVIVGFGGWTDFQFLFAGKNSPGIDRIYGVWALPTSPPGQSLYSIVSNAYTNNLVEVQVNLAKQ
jgi:CubicO group peptidase (beta-lactamase class C family)